MQYRPKALAALLGLMLVAQAAAIVLFQLDATSDQPTALATTQLVNGSRPATIHWANGEHLWEPPPPPPPPTTTTAPTPKHTQPKPTAPKYQAHYVLAGANTGDFASCVRQKESTNNYAYNDGHYKGAYNMEDQHWAGYGGYPSADAAPASVQDQKFAEDTAQGSGYMHEQYPNTSRMCGM